MFQEDPLEAPQQDQPVVNPAQSQEIEQKRRLQATDKPAVHYQYILWEVKKTGNFLWQTFAMTWVIQGANTPQHRSIRTQPALACKRNWV